MIYTHNAEEANYGDELFTKISECGGNMDSPDMKTYLKQLIKNKTPVQVANIFMLTRVLKDEYDRQNT